MNAGKIFELDVKSSTKKQHIWILRLNDTDLSWSGQSSSRFTPTNPCDFLVYKKPFLFPLECKSTKYKSISVQLDKESPQAMIKYSQIEGMLECEEFEGVYGGLLLNFRDEENPSEGKTYWISIGDFNTFIKETGKKSINKLDCVQYGGILLNQKLKRVHFEYDIDKLLNDILKDKEES